MGAYSTTKKGKRINKTPRTCCGRKPPEPNQEEIKHQQEVQRQEELKRQQEQQRQQEIKNNKSKLVKKRWKTEAS